MQSLKKCHKRGRLCRTQILSVGRHIAPALNNLADELVLREPHCNAVECRSSLSAKIPKRMTVATLFGLKNQRALSLERACAVQKSLWDRITAPSIHVWTPGREFCKMSEGTERDCDQQHGQDCNG